MFISAYLLAIVVAAVPLAMALLRLVPGQSQTCLLYT